MQPGLRYCIISIFLFGVYSVDLAGGNPDSLLWVSRAVECERVAFLSEYPGAADSALVEKAVCYRMAGRPADALGTLERVRPYMLDADGRRRYESEKELCRLPDEGSDDARGWGDAAVSLGLDMASWGWVAFNCLDGMWVTGLLGGAIGLNYTFMGTLQRWAASSVE